MTAQPCDFSKIKIRVADLLCHNRHVLTLCKNGVYSLPGGNVENGEDILAALWRELAEETGLSPQDITAPPVLCAVQDHMVSRPGATPAPRKLHFVFRMPLPTQCAVAACNTGEDGAAVWVEATKLAAAHSYPPFSASWLDSTAQAGFGAFDDQSYTWHAPA